MNVERSDYESVDLLPGEHEIAWGSQFLVSVLVNPTGRDEASTRVTAELLADHTYTVRPLPGSGRRGLPVVRWPRWLILSF